MKPAFLFRTLLALLLLFSGLLLAYAEEDPEETESSTTEYSCGAALLDEGASVVSNYEVFLNEYFQVDVPSSEQFENALQYYRFTELAIQAIYQNNLGLSQSGLGTTLGKAVEEAQYCDYVREAYLGYIKTLFRKQFSGSTAYKVTFKVMDGFKVMNSSLDELSGVFNQTFPNLFDKMNNGFACYVHSCATQ